MSLTKSNTRSPSHHSRSNKPSTSAAPPVNPTPHVLFLKQSSATFEAPTQKLSVFFDECNQEIISLTNEADFKTRVVFQVTDRPDKVEFILPVEKKILSIKLNPPRTVLAYHVEKNNITFVNISTDGRSEDGCPIYKFEDRRYVQASRAKNSKLFGFLWTGPMELVMITDLSIEYYHVDSQRRRLKHFKSFQSATNWFVYQPFFRTHQTSEAPAIGDEFHYSILMTSTGSQGNSIQPYMFRHAQIIRLPRFDVEGNWHGSDSLKLFEHSVTIASIYGSVRLLVLQHESLNVKSKGAQILVYTVNQDSGITTKTHTLDLDVSGRFAINVLDNLVIAHDQPSKSSFIFDIMIDSTEKSDCPEHFVSLFDSRPIRPLAMESKNIDMYSVNWVFFQPNFIIDAKRGFLLTLHLDLDTTQQVIQDDNLLLNFLAHRTKSEKIILSKCRDIVANSYRSSTESTGDTVVSSPLADVSSTFELLSNLVISAPELDRKAAVDNKQQQQQQPDNRFDSENVAEENKTSHFSAQICQEDVHREIFRQLESAPAEVSSNWQRFSITLCKPNLVYYYS